MEKSEPLGNPEQDNEILQFFRNKKKGRIKHELKSLPDEAFIDE